MCLHISEKTQSSRDNTTQTYKLSDVKPASPLSLLRVCNAKSTVADEGCIKHIIQLLLLLVRRRRDTDEHRTLNKTNLIISLNALFQNFQVHIQSNFDCQILDGNFWNSQSKIGPGKDVEMPYLEIWDEIPGFDGSKTNLVTHNSQQHMISYSKIVETNFPIKEKLCRLMETLQQKILGYC